MAQHVLLRPATRTVSTSWILDRKNDLIWYIGSSLVGWLYVGIIFLAVLLLENPMRDAFFHIRLGGLEIPVTMRFFVLTSWAILLDAPHLWATIARTFFDPEERKLRRKELRNSWLWFLLGPAAVLVPHALNMILRPFGVALPLFALQITVILFYVFFRLWAYFHICRQHWGFFMLYKRKNQDMSTEANKVDTWSFNLLLYLPVLMWLMGPVYERTPGMPPLGLDALRVGAISVPLVIYYLAWMAFFATLLFWIGYQIRQWLRGEPLNLPKLLLMLPIIPLHLLASNHPYLAALLGPITTVGHNIQYHRIVWQFGQNKYVKSEPKAGFALVRLFFSKAWVYMAFGLLFTLTLIDGPWIDWFGRTTGIALDKSIFAGVGMMAGLENPLGLTVGQQVFGSLLMGWAMQHYYLDGKIWRVGKDQSVAKQLNV